ncbi:MAG: tRNA (5-methylaminomethyl-2-thiouridine)(34)-methyltransferase MnmD [Bacteroidia bacterium]|nr:tRNA (5-methylaminomethyl-2-thiouridine)(34)-methyltransferase MnmD [Bacteroidia bacterium]
MAKPTVEHIITKDGSSTLYSPGFDEHYHSVHGAIQESMHVFIRSGLDLLKDREEIKLLEMGFGTGLNVLLTYFCAGNLRIDYTTLEAYPLSEEQICSLNYPEATGFAGAKEVFQKVHEAPWDCKAVIRETFNLEKVHTRIEDYQTEKKFDLVYYDAFAPTSQPELWEDAMLAKIYEWVRPGGIFVTYSAKSSVRRGLIAAGFVVEKIPGPPGKREMLRGRR